MIVMMETDPASLKEAGLRMRTRVSQTDGGNGAALNPHV